VTAAAWRRITLATRDGSVTCGGKRSSAVARGPGIARARGVRSLTVIVVVVLVAAWAMLRQLPTTAASAVPVAPSRLAEVRSVALDGHRLPVARLRAVIATQPGAQLHSEQLERDRAAMERELGAMGYLAARIEAPDVTFDAAGAAYVTFEVHQGALFHLREVSVTGPGKDAAVVTLGPGDAAIRTRIEATRQALAELLARRGRPSLVELSVHTDLAAAVVDVTFATR
jgi:hypothetical protein